MMKKHIVTIAAMVGSMQVPGATPQYDDLSTPWCDEEHKVIYDGKGYFAVKSPANTQVELCINLDSLHSYVNSNDYKSESPLLLWDTEYDYGLADYADTGAATGSRKASVIGWWAGHAWQINQRVGWAEMRKWADANGRLRVRIYGDQTTGVRMTARDAAGTEHTLYAAPALKTVRNTEVQGYRVNLNYVSAVTLFTPSSLDTSSYTPPPDYTQPYHRTRAGASSLGRVMFMGDSITHGVNDQTWRWQLFKVLVDNGIEAEIVGPRSGYTPGYTRLTTPDAGESYGGVAFPNVHLAQSSGRTHNIISGSNAGMSGVNYGGHSTRSTANAYNCDTWCSLMGTNDLLSDAGYTEADFVAKMQRMLGGSVTCRRGSYHWEPGHEWGNLGRMAADVLREPGDVLYVMSVPCWGRHHNNNAPERHMAVRAYNRLLREWVAAYTAHHGRNLRFVEVNQGMVDPAHAVPFSWPDSMSNRPGRDGLHPNAQGSLIIAGNLARAMGLAGRTAGLPRASAAGDDWAGASIGNLAAGQRRSCAVGDLVPRQGYSVECRVAFGNGGKGGWADARQALSISIGDGVHGGCLRVSEGSILWGDTALYGGDCSQLSEPLRVVWHPGNAEHNVQRGFYVWLGDLLIGQGLPPQTDAPTTGGIRLEAHGAAARVDSLRWCNRAWAPVSEGQMDATHAYRVPREQ